MEETTRPKVISTPAGSDGQTRLFESYIGCELCWRSLDRSFIYCPTCGRRIDWGDRDEH